MLKNRIGKFAVSRKMFEEDKLDRFKSIFTHGLIIIGVDPNQVYNGMEYTAIWEKFDEVEEGKIIPRYNLKYEITEDHKVTNIVPERLS